MSKEMLPNGRVQVTTFVADQDAVYCPNLSGLDHCDRIFVGNEYAMEDKYRGAVKQKVVAQFMHGENMGVISCKLRLNLLNLVSFTDFLLGNRWSRYGHEDYCGESNDSFCVA